MTSGSRRIPYGASPPDAWKVVPLKHLAVLHNGYVFKSDGWADSGTPIIRIENLNGSGSFNHSRLALSEKHHVRAGDLLFSWSGNPGTSFGPFRWEKPGLHFLNQHIFKVSVQGCEKNWLYWSLQAATYWIERELTSGMIGMVHVTKEDLGNVPIPVPPRDEQRRIADFLDAETARIDALVEARDRQLRLLKELGESRLATEVENLIADHGVIALRRVVRSVQQGWSPQCEDAPAGPDEWAVLRTSAVSSGVFRPQEHKRLPDDLRPDVRHRILDGDLLMTRGSGSAELVGVSAVARTEGRKLLLSDLLYRVRTDRGWNPDFVALMLRSRPVRAFTSLLMRGQSGQTIKLRSEDIKGIRVPAVPVGRQAGIAAGLTAGERTIEAARTAVEASSALLAERRRSLITAAVTGRLDVTAARRTHERGL
ncbi:restriction endonuclease subunit S [Streptomyces sp. NPDC006267]|uniref:restriction endonuclease subunit S n=1 Tax=unclassified Streptomyces TaxID=2593676 RepID=UPI0033A8CA18